MEPDNFQLESDSPADRAAREAARLERLAFLTKVIVAEKQQQGFVKTSLTLRKDLIASVEARFRDFGFTTRSDMINAIIEFGLANVQFEHQPRRKRQYRRRDSEK